MSSFLLLWTPKEKLSIVLQGLKGAISVAELRNQHQISQSQNCESRDIRSPLPN